MASHLQRYVSLDDFSSFEHVRLALQYEHRFDRLWLAGGAAVRAYTPPINPFAGREQRVAFELELRGRIHIDGALGVYAAVYVEGVGHELPPARVGLATLPALFVVVRGELGVSLASEDVGRLALYVGVVDMDGRGIDFIRHYGPDFLAGIRGTL